MAADTTCVIFPSIEAFKRAKGKGAAVTSADPFAKFNQAFGLWFTGAIRDTAKPLPVLVEVKEETRARDLARKGGRPLADGDPELKALLVEFYKGKDAKDIPSALADFLTSESAAAAKPATLPDKPK